MCLWLRGGVVTPPPWVVTTISLVTTPVTTGCKLSVHTYKIHTVCARAVVVLVT